MPSRSVLTRAGRALCLGAGLALICAGPAAAQFPGHNGRIGFVSDQTGHPEIYTAAADGSHVKQVTHTAPSTYNADPSFSADGRKIVFARGTFTKGTPGSEEIYVMNANGSGERQLTTATEGDNLEPAFSPDGTIAFVSDRNGQNEIYVMHGDGSDQRNLTGIAPTVANEGPSFSPDGKPRRCR